MDDIEAILAQIMTDEFQTILEDDSCYLVREKKNNERIIAI